MALLVQRPSPSNERYSVKRVILCASSVEVVCPDCGESLPQKDGSLLWLREDVESHMDSEMKCPACDLKLRMQINTRKVLFE